MKAEIQVKLEEKLRKRLMRLPEFVADYIFYLEYRKKELRTRIEYAKDIELFFEYLLSEGLVKREKIEDITPSDLNQLKPRDIANFLGYLTCYKKTFITPTGKVKVQQFTNSDAGKSRKMATLHEFFNYLVENELIEKDVTKKIEVKVDPQASIKNRLTPEDMEKFYTTILEDCNIESERQLIFHQKVKFRDYIIVLLLSYTGIRISELVQLDIGDIGIDEQAMVVIRKGGKKEKVDLPSRIMEDIKEYLEQRMKMEYDTKALFVSLHKKRIDPRTVRAMLDKYRKRAGINIKVTPHVFRRTFGTEHYNRYRDMYLTAQIMGHRSAETTRKFYADPAEERRRKSMQEFDYQMKEEQDSKVTISIEKLKELEKLTGVNIEKLLQTK
jgi:site-specific recombinase XerD